jgi:hypothetical protein
VPVTLYLSSRTPIVSREGLREIPFIDITDAYERSVAWKHEAASCLKPVVLRIAADKSAVLGRPVWCHRCMVADNTTVLAMPSSEAAESLALVQRPGGRRPLPSDSEHVA